MKIRMILTITLNDATQDAWIEYHGVPKDEIEASVKRHIANQIIRDDFFEIIGKPIDISWE